MDTSITPSLSFVKMHGIGNDYVYFDCVRGPVPADPSRLSVLLSDRHTGVGGDGIILVGLSSVADFSMRIFNADGSEARMCGNGIRCVGKLVYDHGLTRRTSLAIETLSGIRHLTLHPDADGIVRSVTVDMGEPRFRPDEVGCARVMTGEEVEGFPGVRLTAVSMGNPHGVIVVDSAERADVHRLGPRLEAHPMWTDRANIEFVEVLDRIRIRMRVWERGSGETMACGTGACASAVACARLGLTGRKVSVGLPGGTLDICWDESDNHVYMTGPAAEVFSGSVNLKNLES